MTPTRSAEALLTEGARLAHSLGAVLVAGYVVTEHRAQDHAILDDNVALAKRLGATVVSTTASDVSDGLVALAEREGVTHAILGHSDHPATLFDPGSVVAAFVSRSRGVQVQVVGRPTSGR
jgi:K+-sensing histidine kinase KdpD